MRYTVNQRRVAFCGASGTGKSTVCEEVAGQLFLPMCPVGSRDTAISMGFGSPYDVDAAGKRADFQTRLLQRKRVWEEAEEQFVTDRTHFDNLSYTRMHAPDLGAEPAFETMVRHASERYTHIVFCPIRAFHNLANDPMRIAELTYHQRYEEHLLAVLKTHRPVLMLLTPDRGERAQQVIDFVR